MQRIGDVTPDALAVLREAREVAPARTAAELEAEVAAVRWVRDCATALGGRCPTLLYATDDEHLRTWARAVVVVLVSAADDGVLVGSRGRVVGRKGAAAIKGLIPAIQRTAELVVEHDRG